MRDTCTSIADKVILGKEISKGVKTWVDIVNSTHLLLKKDFKTWSGG